MVGKFTLESLWKTFVGLNCQPEMNGIKLFFFFLLSIYWLSNSSIAQVVEIPREGFPYCEPFTGPGPFENTIINGNIRNNVTGATGSYTPTATGHSLQLTPNLEWHNGYVIVDIPFSSQFGVKTSFEYYTYGNTPLDYAADGIGFFMFDADEPVNIGWLGGSLGYAPFVNADGTVDPGKNGIIGGYLGIGFDEWGNFAVGTVGEPLANWEDKVRNSITIRSPEGNNYDVYKRFVTTPDSSNPTILPDLPSNFWFPIDHKGPNRVDDCAQPGYRKVFIELIPSGVGYQIKIDMLVNHSTFASPPQPISFPPVNYPFPAPPRLKIGFTGATGGWSNFHEIANVTVNVSDIANISDPIVADQNEFMCVGDGDLDMEFNVQLATSDAFITCLQLFDTSPGSPDNSVPPTDFTNCGLDGNLCVIKCVPANYTINAYDANGNFAGTFYSELQDLNTGNFNQLRDVVNVRFEPAPGFSGQASVYYNVTDNYGLTSEPGIITVTANPYPVINPAVTLVNPSCDGQEDGNLSGLTVTSLVPGFDYEWLYNGISIGKTGATNTYNAGTRTGVFALQGLNLGTYTLNVWNPSSSGGCYETHDVIIDQENGTPVDVILDDQLICEGTPVTFTPELEDPTDASSPSYVWWKDNNKTQKITPNLTEGNVKYEIDASGILTITGLAQSATPYEFYVEAESDPIQNVCSSLAGNLKRVQVTVSPPLTISATVVDDPCSEGIGSISVNASGGSGSLVYSLDGGPSQNSNTFSGLFPGTYTVQVSAGANCIGVITSEVKAAPAIDFELIKVIQPACGEPNGLLEVDFSGGTPPYTLEFVKDGVVVETATSPSSPRVYQNLGPGAYEIRLKDSIFCSKVLTQTLTNSDGIAISIAPMKDEICFGDVAKIIPVVTTAGSAELKWYKDSAGTQEIVSSASPDADGHVFTINSTTQELSIGGLKAGDYKFYLIANGPGYCPNPPFVADVKVLEPISATAVVTNETCIGEKDGTITVNPTGADGNFEFSLNNAPFVSNNVFENLAPGTYTIQIRSTGDNGCTFQTTTIVEGPSAPITINTPDLLRASCDLENGSIENLQISGGWGNYQVEWRKGSATGPVIPGTLSGAANLGPDTYFVLISDSEGCAEQFSFVIEESSDPVYQLVNPINSCLGDPVTIRPIHIAPDPSLPPTAFTEVKWYKEPGQVGLIANGPDSQDPSIRYTIDDSDWLNPQLLIENLPAGTHDFYFYVECTGQEIKAELSVYAIPEVVFDTTPVTCFGDTNGKIILSSGTIPEYRYAVNGAAPIDQTALEALNLAAGTYSIEVSTPAGCPQTETVVIESPTAALEISPITQLDPGCGASNGKLDALINGGWLPYAVTLTKNGAAFNSFTSPDGILSVSALGAGVYQFEITDAQGCQIVSAPADLVDGPTQIQVDNLEICSGEDAIFTPVLDPAATGATYTWTFDAAGTNPITSGSTVAGVAYQISSDGVLTVSGLASSNSAYRYYLTASGADVCTGFVANAEVRVFDSPQATYTVQNEVCFGEGGQIQINATGGSGTYTYSLNGQPEQTSNSFLVPVGTYSVTVNTPQGCFVELTNIEVTGPSAALQVTNLSQVNPSCELANGSISFTVTGGYGDYSVAVIKDGRSTGTVQADANGLVTINGIGFGVYEFEISDAEGCILTLDEPLDLVEVPTEVTANEQRICEGESAQISPSVPSGIQNPSFAWYFDANQSQPIQPGSSNGVTYAINAAGQLSVSGLPAREAPYTYFVMASGAGICGVEPKPVNVYVSSIPTLRVSNPSVVCDPEGTVDLTNFIEGFNPTLYDYDVVSPNGSALTLNQLDAVDLTGDYRVSSSLKNANCWNPAQRIRVIISDSLLVAGFQYTADLGDGTIATNDKVQIFEPVQFQDLSVGRVIIWNWDFGDGSGSSSQNPSHTYSKKGSYTVTLSTIDQFGCQSEYVMQVLVTDEYKVMVPNAFTPSGQKNQYFKPIHRGIAAIDFYVFNTWGELIYNSNDLQDIGWDGTLKGENVPNGNYVYKVNYQTRSGEIHEISGVFILIR